MSADAKVRQIYNDTIHEITKSPGRWKDMLGLMGRIYRYEFDNVVLIYAQKPKANLVADYDTWWKVGRNVKRGSKGIVIYPSKVLEPHQRYVFDISDTAGRNQNLTWKLDDELIEKYAAFLVKTTDIPIRADMSMEEIKDVIWDFTKSNIRSIIKESHSMSDINISESLSQLMRISGKTGISGEDLIEKSIDYVVARRCGFELSEKEQDFTGIEAINKEDVIYELGSLISDVSCEVLREFSDRLLEIERGDDYELRTELQRREGRNTVSMREYGAGEPGGSGQVRSDGNGISEGEPLQEIQITGEIREADGGVVSGERGSTSDDRYYRGKVPEEPQAGESGVNDGAVEDQTAGTVDGGGDRDTRYREQVPLTEEEQPAESELPEEEPPEIDEALQAELDELNNMGMKRETAFEQVSLFPYHGSVLTDEEQTTKKKYDYLNPKVEKEVPHEYITYVLLRGSGFVDGKKRIYKIMSEEIDKSVRVKRIKKEYGLGGSGWPLEGYGLHGYDTFKGKGIRFQWRDEEGEKEGYLSWNAVDTEISALILTGQYISEEELLDEYAIPDEVAEMERDGDDETDRAEDYEAYLRSNPGFPLDENNIEDEDRLITLAEYGEEMMREAEMTDFSLPDMTLKGQVAPENPENFHLDIWSTKDGGPKTRYCWNIDAIKELKKIEAEGRAASVEEQKVLSRYVGWGGLAQVFDADNDMWKNEYEELKALLTPEEYKAARESVNNAFYTPSTVTNAITRALVNFGLKDGNILEPSMGVGNFFGSMPEELSASKMYGVELDSITGRIAKLLYPKAEIQIKGFEQTEYPDNFFDVVVGNVPFGDYKVFDPKYNKLGFKVHDYFIAKAIDQVRPGGIVAVITTKGTMDKKNPAVRKYIAERAELLGAVRLPTAVFEGNAGTEVTSDILIFQKRERKIAIEPDWIHLGMTEDGIPVNSYFAEHPDMMLGKMEYDTGRFGDNSNYTVCVNREPFKIYESVSEALSKIDARIKHFEMISEEEESLTVDIPADPDVKNFTFTVVDGDLYFRKDSRMYKWDVPEKTKGRIINLHNIRELTRKLINLQLEGCTEEELKNMQKILNARYDMFVKNYGYITSRTNNTAFSEDADYPLLCSLENVDENGNVTKTDIFTKQTIRQRQEVDHVETAVEALNISINDYGRVNLPYMLSLYDLDISRFMKEIAEKTGENTEDIGLSAGVESELKREKLIEELQGVIFLNPSTYNEEDRNIGWETSDQYLSGNVREKLRIAESHAADDPELFASNVEALKRVQPKDLDATEIDVGIGTSWIEPEDYQQFIYELLNTPHYARETKSRFYGNSGIKVNLNRYSMEWFIENKSRDKHSVAATKTYGTGRMDAYTIFENSLNMRIVTIRDRVDDGGGKYHYVENKEETMLARAKQEEMKQEFKRWIWEDQERRQKYVDYYNETFNSVRLREYDGSFLSFPGMNPDITLQDHQRNAVARVLFGGNTLLAHCVGAGKSFEMMASCMEQKRLGLINKAVMVVPKALVRQTASEFMRLYPSANILVTSEKDFAKKRRQQFISRIATGDYDCVIMSHSQFERIPISKERQQALLEKQVEELTFAIDEMKSRNGEQWSVKQMEAAKKNITAQIKELADAERDDLITFEELGIDCLIVDECQAFKNLAVFSKMTNVSGITSSGSKRAMDMYLKCQYVSEINGGRGIIFATGTPISNTMVEMYVFQTYLQKELLEQMGIYHFDAWAANFGEVTSSLELTVEGNGFRFKNRFNKFKNLPELMNIFKECADIRMRDSLQLDVPELRGGNYIIESTEPDWYTKQVMEDFVKRAERIHNGGVDPSVDNFLKITNDARLLGTDARLLDPTAPVNPEGKLNQVVDNVYAEYIRAKDKGIIGTQLVFSDIGTPKSSWKEEMLEEGYYDRGHAFDVYNYIKTELVRRGIPAEEIAFVHDANTDAQRETLFKEMRLGKKKIMIGSTEKCGTGVNVQTHLVALHHVDCPWKPACIEQREGRGLRQGNENDEVAIYRYVTKGTFDAYSWSVVENKQRFISQVMTSKAVSRSCDDIDEVTFQYAEIKAVATGNPLIKEKMQIDNDVQRLRLLKSSYDSQRYQHQDNFMVRLPKLIAAAEEKLSGVKADVKLRDKMAYDQSLFHLAVGISNYEEREPAGRALLSAINSAKTGTTTEIGEYKGFKIKIEKNFMDCNYLILSGKNDYKMETSVSPVGMVTRIENKFNAIHEYISFYEERLEQYHRDMEQAKSDYEKPFEYEAELNEKLQRQIEINIQLDVDRQAGEENHERDDPELAEEMEPDREEREENVNRSFR